jgi:hypothetical protein
LLSCTEVLFIQFLWFYSITDAARFSHGRQAL